MNRLLLATAVAAGLSACATAGTAPAGLKDGISLSQGGKVVSKNCKRA